MRFFFTSKLIIFITLPIVILSMIALFNIKHTLQEDGMNQLKAHMLELVQHYAAIVGTELDRTSTITNTTALLLANSPIESIDTHYNIIKSNISQNRVIFGSAIAYERGVFPKKELFGPYVYRDNENFSQMDISVDAYDYTDSKWSWYNDPKLQLKGVWSEPYFDEGAGNVLMITYSAPIIKKELFVGVVTVDLDLFTLHSTLDLEALKDSDYVILTNTGHFAYHSKSELIGKSFLDIAGKLELDKSVYIARKMITGEKGYIEIENEENGNEMVFFAPVGDYGWSFALSLSKESAEKIIFFDNNTTQIWLLVILVLGLFLSVYVANYTFYNPLKKLKDGVADLDSGISLDIKQSDGPYRELSNIITNIYIRQKDEIDINVVNLDKIETKLHEQGLELEHADRRTNGLLSAAQNPVVVISRIGEIVATNDKSESVLKLKIKNMIGENILAFIDDGDKELFSKTIEDLFSSVVVKELPNITIVTKLKVKVKVRVVLTPVFLTEDDVEANVVFIKIEQ